VGFPVLFIAACGTGFVSLVGEPPTDTAIERWFGVEPMTNGWRREAVRVATWTLVINVAHIAFCIVPLVGIRQLLLWPSVLVP
jgi:hypothetical protein